MLEEKGPPEIARINIHEPQEVVYWTSAFGVTEQELRQLVQQHGPYVEAVTEALGQSSLKNWKPLHRDLAHSLVVSCGKSEITWVVPSTADHSAAGPSLIDRSKALREEAGRCRERGELQRASELLREASKLLMRASDEMRSANPDETP